MSLGRPLNHPLEEEKETPGLASAQASEEIKPEYEDVEDECGFYIGYKEKNKPDAETTRDYLYEVDLNSLSKEILQRPARQRTYFWNALRKGHLGQMKLLTDEHHFDPSQPVFKTKTQEKKEVKAERLPLKKLARAMLEYEDKELLDIEKIFDLLIEKGVNPNKNKDGLRALASLIYIFSPEKIKARHSKLNKETLKNVITLRTNIIKKLLNNILNINDLIRDRYDHNKKTTLLMIAINKNDIDVTRMLLQHGAKLDLVAQEHHITNISSAVHLAHDKITEALITHAIECEEKDERKLTEALGSAIPSLFSPQQLKQTKEFITQLKKLIELKADVNARGENEETVLHILLNPPNTYRFSEKALQTILTILLDAGLDISLKNKEGKTALDIANELTDFYFFPERTRAAVNFILTRPSKNLSSETQVEEVKPSTQEAPSKIPSSMIKEHRVLLEDCEDVVNQHGFLEETKNTKLGHAISTWRVESDDITLQPKELLARPHRQLKYYWDALKSKNIANVKFLIEKCGFDPKKPAFEGGRWPNEPVTELNPIDTIVSANNGNYNKAEKLLDYLLKLGVDAKQYGKSALFTVVMQQGKFYGNNRYSTLAISREIINKLASAGVDLNASMIIGSYNEKATCTPLLVATAFKYHHDDICRILLKNGASLDHTLHEGHETAISNSIGLNLKELTPDLIDHAVELEQKGQCNITAAFGPALHSMFSFNQREKNSPGYLAKVEKLVELKADVNAKSYNDDTALHYMLDPMNLDFEKDALKKILTLFLESGFDLSNVSQSWGIKHTFLDLLTRLIVQGRYNEELVGIYQFMRDFILTWVDANPEKVKSTGALFVNSRELIKYSLFKPFEAVKNVDRYGEFRHLKSRDDLVDIIDNYVNEQSTNSLR